MNRIIKISNIVIVIIAISVISSIVYFKYSKKLSNPTARSIDPSSQLAQVSPSATLTLDPSNYSGAVGSIFEVSIIVNSGNQDIYAVDINRLNFNANMLEVVDDNLDINGVQIRPGILLGINQFNTVNNTLGTVQFSQSAFYDPFITYKGTSGELARIKFRVKSVGTSAITFDFTYGRSTDTNVVGLSGDLLASVGTGSYTGTPAVPIQRNIIFILEGAPSSKRDVSATIQFLNSTDKAVLSTPPAISTNTSGQYTMTVPAGLPSIVTLRPVVRGYLSKLLTSVDLTNTATLNATFPTLFAGDLNGDQIINTLDFSYMNSKWGTADALADFDKNGSVNANDFVFVSRNWLLRGE